MSAAPKTLDVRLYYDFASSLCFVAHRVLERMQEIGMPLLVHAEITDPDVDIFMGKIGQPCACKHGLNKKYECV